MRFPSTTTLAVRIAVKRLMEMDLDSGSKFGRGEREYDTAVAAYQHLRDSLNATRGHGWDTIPWVWVVEFKRTGA